MNFQAKSFMIKRDKRCQIKKKKQKRCKFFKNDEDDKPEGILHNSRSSHLLKVKNKENFSDEIKMKTIFMHFWLSPLSYMTWNMKKNTLRIWFCSGENKNRNLESRVVSIYQRKHESSSAHISLFRRHHLTPPSIC